MSGSYAESVLGAFDAVGRGTPRLICESTDAEHFGDGSVTLELDGLRLHVVSDRGIQTVEVGLKIVNPVGGPPVHPALGGFRDGAGIPTCPLEVLAVVKGWTSLERVVDHYELNDGHDGRPRYDENEPPPGPFYELQEALSLLADGEKWADLVAASRDHRLQLEAGVVEELLQARVGAQFHECAPSSETGR